MEKYKGINIEYQHIQFVTFQRRCQNHRTQLEIPFLKIYPKTSQWIARVRI